MRDILMTASVLVFPLIVLVMMTIMGVALYRDMRAAKRSGEDLV